MVMLTLDGLQCVASFLFVIDELLRLFFRLLFVVGHDISVCPKGLGDLLLVLLIKGGLLFFIIIAFLVFLVFFLL